MSKKILSLLLCLVFLQAESFALRGGPSGSGTQEFAGLYAGVMTPDLTDPNNTAGIASDLGMFLLLVPGTGPATGSIVIFEFNTGSAFLGILEGIADTDSGVLTGIFQAAAKIADLTTASVNVQTGATTPVTIYLDYTMAGTMRLQATKSKKSLAAQRVIGKGVGSIQSPANASVNTGGNTPLSVYVAFNFDGFRQTANQGATLPTFTVGTAPAGQ